MDPYVKKEDHIENKCSKFYEAYFECTNKIEGSPSPHKNLKILNECKVSIYSKENPLKVFFIIIESYIGTGKMHRKRRDI